MKRTRFVLAVVAAVFGAGYWAAQASAYIYWGSYDDGLYGAIGRANLDGTGVDQGFLFGAAGDEPEVGAVAVDDQHLYWSDNDGTTIGRANLDGTDPDQLFITGASTPYGVAVDSQYVYWTSYSSGTIGRANLNGTDPDPSFVTGASHPVAVAVDGQYIYWANSNTDSIGRANLDGTDPDESFITGASGPTAVAVNGQYIYWTNYTSGTIGGGSIGRANLDGTDPDQSFITGASGPSGLAVNSQYTYWANESGGTIGRANLDGTDPDESFVTGIDEPAGLAVDGAPGTATPSSTSLSFGTQALDTYGAPQQLTVTNTGTGALSVAGAQLSGGGSDAFLITADTCTNAQLAIGASCTIDVRFGPTATGPRSATLTVSSDDSASPLSIPLGGTGGTLPQGPPGTNGTNGTNGRVGATGPTGPAGQIELVTCKSVTTGKGKHKKTTEKCTTKLTSKPIKFKTSERLATASLSRGNTVYAVGTATSTGKHTSLELLPLRTLRKGSYTLALTRGRTRRRETVTIA
jgi:hypothetical protein